MNRSQGTSPHPTRPNDKINIHSSERHIGRWSFSFTTAEQITQAKRSEGSIPLKCISSEKDRAAWGCILASLLAHREWHVGSEFTIQISIEFCRAPGPWILFICLPTKLWKYMWYYRKNTKGRNLGLFFFFFFDLVHLIPLQRNKLHQENSTKTSRTHSEKIRTDQNFKEHGEMTGARWLNSWLKKLLTKSVD